MARGDSLMTNKNWIELACIIVAGVLAYNKIDGWGWFVFAALVI